MHFFAKLACGAGGLITAFFALNAGALWYLQTTQARFQTATGCVLTAGGTHMSVGVAAYRRVFDAAVVRCPYGGNVGGALVVYSAKATIDLALWHPLSMRLTLEGGQKIGRSNTVTTFSAQTDGAAVHVFVPFWQPNGVAHSALISSSFLHFTALPQKGGALAGQGATLQKVQAKVVWNTQTSAQSSLLGVALTAQSAAFTVWKDPIAEFALTVSAPGPATAHQGMWQVLGKGADASLDSGTMVNPVEPGTQMQQDRQVPDLIVQNMSGKWHGLRVGWSARLWVQPSADIEGESWLTVPDWHAVFETLKAEKYLTPYQQAIVQNMQDTLAKQHALPSGPLKLPLAVRNGQVSFGPCRVGVLGFNCPNLL